MMLRLSKLYPATVSYVVAKLILTLIMTSIVMMSLACSRNSDKEKIIQRTTDNLHVYQDLDYIQYTVTGTVSSVYMERDAAGIINQATNPLNAPYCGVIYNQTGDIEVSGTLTLNWLNNSAIAKPLLTGGSYEVKRQESILALDSIGSYTTNAFISQDGSTGALTLRAYEDTPLSTYYWVTANADLNSITNPVYMPSPIPILDTVYATNYVNTGCDGAASCTNSIRQVTHNLSFNGDNLSNEENRGGLQTALGLFNPINVQFTENYLDVNSTNIAAKLDVKGFCDDPVFFVYPIKATQPSFDTEPARFPASPKTEAYVSGQGWLLPEVGMLQLEFYCSSNLITTIDDLATSSLVNPPSDGCVEPPRPIGPDGVTTIDFRFPETTTYHLTAEISSTNITLPQ